MENTQNNNTMKPVSLETMKSILDEFKELTKTYDEANEDVKSIECVIAILATRGLIKNDLIK
jgi:hypothetical protein